VSRKTAIVSRKMYI